MRETDRGADQQNPSGTAGIACATVRIYGCNLPLHATMNLELSKRGRPCTIKEQSARAHAETRF